MIGQAGYKILQGPAGVAAGDGFGSAVLPDHQGVSKGGVVWFDKSDQAVVQFGRCECCGRSWTGKFGFLCPVPSDRTGITQGNRNTFASLKSCWIGQGNRSERCATGLRRHRTHAAFANPIHTGKAIMSLFAIRYSLFATYFLRATS